MKDNRSKINAVIIVVLAVSLVSSLTYIILSNKVSSKSTDKTSTSSISYPSTVKTLAITEWGIEGHYMGAQPLQYEMKDTNILRFTSSSIKDVCGYNYSGFITRYTGDQHIDQKGYGVVDASTKNTSSAADSSLPKVHIGDYYYNLSGALASCITPANIAKDIEVKNSEGLSMKISSAQGDVSSEVGDLFLTLAKK